MASLAVSSNPSADSKEHLVDIVWSDAESSGGSGDVTTGLQVGIDYAGFGRGTIGHEVSNLSAGLFLVRCCDFNRGVRIGCPTQVKLACSLDLVPPFPAR